jgi:hypothetical protein
LPKQNRLRELSLEGDLDKTAYQAQKSAISECLAALTVGGDPDNGDGERLAGFLADVASAWRVDTREVHNRLARLLVAETVVENTAVLAVVPRPEFAPFFNLVKRGCGGSDGDRLREIDVVSLPLISFLYPERLLRSMRRSGVGRYSTVTQGRRIPRERWAEVAVRAKREGLLAVARDTGVSHEKVSLVVRSITVQERVS